MKKLVTFHHRLKRPVRNTTQPIHIPTSQDQTKKKQSPPSNRNPWIIRQFPFNPDQFHFGFYFGFYFGFLHQKCLCIILLPLVIIKIHTSFLHKLVIFINNVIRYKHNWITTMVMVFLNNRFVFMITVWKQDLKTVTDKIHFLRKQQSTIKSNKRYHNVKHIFFNQFYKFQYILIPN